MEAKDVALLGFVSAAQKYVDKNIGNGSKLGDLENVDIKTLKDELSAQLKLLAMPIEKKKELLATGEKAFAEYVIENIESKNNVIDELGQIFNVSFDEFDIKPIEETDTIDDLLDAYDMSEDVEVVSTINEPVINEEVENLEPDEFGLKADDDILLTIASQAAKSDEELAKMFKQTDIKESENLDAAFAAVVNNEKHVEEAVQEEQPKISTSKQIEIAKAIENVEQAKESLSKVLKSIGETEAADTGYFKYFENTEIDTQPKQKTVSKPTNTLSNELKNIGENINKVEIKQTTVQPQPLNIIVNPGLDVVLEQENNSLYDVSKEEERATTSENAIKEKLVDQTLSEALAGLGKLQEKQETKKVQEVVKPVPEIKVEQKKQVVVEEKPISQNRNDENKVYSNIMVAYPYLNKSFVVSVYKQKDEIAKEYKLGNDYIIIHRVTFTNLEELHEFVEIMMAHNYLVNVDENKMIVDAIRELTNREGIILTNIFSIANQARILNGDYEGYRILEKGE